MSDCAYCKQNSDFMCERCGMAYCSRKCQTLDREDHRLFCVLHPMEVSNESMPSLNMQSQTLDSENFFEIFDSAYAFQLGPLNSLGTSTSDQFNFSVSNEARVSLNDKDAEVNITNEGNRSLTESIERLKPAISSNERAIENKRVFTKNILFKVFHGNDIKVLVLDNSFSMFGYVSCIAKDDAGLFGRNNTKMQKYCQRFLNDKECSGYLPSKTEVCLIKTDDGNDWFRAICLKHYDNEFISVLLIDYGDVISVNISNVRKISTGLLFPCITVVCYIEGFYSSDKDRISPENSYRLQKLLPMYRHCYFQFARPINDECACICKLKQKN